MVPPRMSSQSDIIATACLGSCPRREQTSHSFNGLMKFSDLLITFVLLIGSCVLFPFLDCNGAELLNEIQSDSKWSSLQFKPVLLPYLHLHLLFTSCTITLLTVMSSKKKKNTIREKINNTIAQNELSLHCGQCFGAQQFDYPLPLITETKHRQRSHIWDCSLYFSH